MFFAYPWNGFLHATVAQMLESALRGPDAAFKLALLDKCGLVERLLQAVAANAAEEAKEKGVRRGYMAFVTQITTCLLQVAELNEEVAAALRRRPDWQQYVDSSFADIRAIESKPLGGLKVTPAPSSLV